MWPSHLLLTPESFRPLQWSLAVWHPCSVGHGSLSGLRPHELPWRSFFRIYLCGHADWNWQGFPRCLYREIRGFNKYQRLNRSFSPKRQNLPKTATFKKILRTMGCWLVARSWDLSCTWSSSRLVGRRWLASMKPSFGGPLSAKSTFFRLSRLVERFL